MLFINGLLLKFLNNLLNIILFVASQLWNTTLNPDYRTLKQVTVDSGAEADRVFSMLMGDEVPPRREFIEANAKYANIDA